MEDVRPPSRFVGWPRMRLCRRRWNRTSNRCPWRVSALLDCSPQLAPRKLDVRSSTCRRARLITSRLLPPNGSTSRRPIDWTFSRNGLWLDSNRGIRIELAVQRDRRTGADEARPYAQRGRSGDRRRADPGRTRNSEVIRGTSAGSLATGLRSHRGLPLSLRPGDAIALL